MNVVFCEPHRLFRGVEYYKNKWRVWEQTIYYPRLKQKMIVLTSFGNKVRSKYLYQGISSLPNPASM